MGYGQLKPDGYIPHIADRQLERMLATLGAVEAAAHIAALQDLYVVERLTGGDAPIRSKTRLRTKPKRYFADPSLAASLLQVSPERLVSDGQLFGLLFESLCIHDLAVYASALPAIPIRGDRRFRAGRTCNSWLFSPTWDLHKGSRQSYRRARRL